MRISQDGRATHVPRFLVSGLLIVSMLMLVPTMAVKAAAESAAPDTGSRFTLVAGEYSRNAVRDNKTGLVWEQSPQLALFDWDMAQRRCSSDWRVPTVQELSTLVDRSSIDVKLPAGHPFANVEPAIYWSATEGRNSTAYGSFVNFSSGRAATLEKYMPAFVWCVRAGMNGK